MRAFPDPLLRTSVHLLADTCSGYCCISLHHLSLLRQRGKAAQPFYASSSADDSTLSPCRFLQTLRRPAGRVVQCSRSRPSPAPLHLQGPRMPQVGLHKQPHCLLQWWAAVLLRPDALCRMPGGNINQASRGSCRIPASESTRSRLPACILQLRLSPWAAPPE